MPHRRRLFAAAGLAAASVTGFAWLAGAPPFDAPTFWASHPPQGSTFVCTSGGSFHVRFSPDGRRAMVTVSGRQLILDHRWDMAWDGYRQGPWDLTLDPEASLTGPGIRLVNCNP